MVTKDHFRFRVMHCFYLKHFNDFKQINRLYNVYSTWRSKVLSNWFPETSFAYSNCFTVHRGHQLILCEFLIRADYWLIWNMDAYMYISTFLHYWRLIYGCLSNRSNAWQWFSKYISSVSKYIFTGLFIVNCLIRQGFCYFSNSYYQTDSICNYNIAPVENAKGIILRVT